MWNSARTAVFACLFFSALVAGTCLAGDEEGCLFCHRLGLAVRSGKEVRVLQVGEYPAAAHGSLYCSDCHPDAKDAPHSARPGPAACVGDCHGATASARESHRKAYAGGGTELHRKASFPRAPCLLCHRAEDRPGNVAGPDSRCRDCHPGKNTREGIHSRVSSAPGANRCAACHPPHPGPGGGGTASCAGAGCHDRVSRNMLRLAEHGKESEPGLSSGRVGRGGVFLAVLLMGWLGGRRLSGGTPKARRKR